MTAAEDTKRDVTNPEPLVAMRGIEKSFSGVKVLDDVDFEIVAGEFTPWQVVMALENLR